MPYIVPDYIHAPLYVICPITNPIRFKSRWHLYVDFAKRVKDAGGVLVTVEASFANRHHALAEGVTEHGQPIFPLAPTKPTEFHKALTTEDHIYLQLQTSSEIWLKENLLNLGIQRLPVDWKYCAWVDADLQFVRPDWVRETIHQLQHYKVVQMWTEAQDVSPTYGPLKHRMQSFMDCYRKNLPFPNDGRYGLPACNGVVQWHPGFAWAARRDAIDDLGGLIDWAIMGAGDQHMAHSLIGTVERTFREGMHPRYREMLIEWQYRAERYIRRNVGCVDGLIIHYWHGKKKDRQYLDRWSVITDVANPSNAFNPDIDLKPDWQGVHQLVDRGDARSRAIRDGAMKVMRQRHEDSIDV